MKGQTCQPLPISGSLFISSTQCRHTGKEKQQQTA